MDERDGQPSGRERIDDGTAVTSAAPRTVTDGDLRSGWVTLPLLLGVVWLNDLPVLPAALAAGVPAGPAYAYVENRVLRGATQRVVLLLVAVAAFAAVAVAGSLGLAMWLLVGGTAGMQAFGYAERWWAPGEPADRDDES